MISITVDTASFAKQMSELQKNQLPFATSVALNNTALQFQKAEQDRIAQKFTLRRPAFILQTVKINRADFSTKEKLEVKIQIDPERNVLAKFEEGGTKTAQSGGSVAIPIEAKTNKQDIITAANRPKAFQLVTMSTKGGYSVAKGLKRVFEIEKSDGTGEIFQRVGRGKSSTLKLLFELKKSVPIPATLGFMPTAERVVKENFPRNFEAAFKMAMSTARGA